MAAHRTLNDAFVEDGRPLKERLSRGCARENVQYPEYPIAQHTEIFFRIFFLESSATETRLWFTTKNFMRLSYFSENSNFSLTTADST